jgi:hypothetical protein
LAGDESLNWHPLVSDFILVGQKLEKLGSMYHKGYVMMVEPLEIELANPHVLHGIQKYV